MAEKVAGFFTSSKYGVNLKTSFSYKITDILVPISNNREKGMSLRNW